MKTHKTILLLLASLALSAPAYSQNQPVGQCNEPGDSCDTECTGEGYFNQGRGNGQGKGQGKGYGRGPRDGSGNGAGKQERQRKRDGTGEGCEESCVES